MRPYIRGPVASLRLLSVLVGTAAAAGCAALAGHGEQTGTAAHPVPHLGQQARREAVLGARWRGQSHAALIQSLGRPRMVMTIPGQRPLPTLALVYGVQDEAAACVDAFTIVKEEDTGQWWVADYFCR